MHIIFTNHAQERMRKRKMAQSDIEKTISGADFSKPGKQTDTIKFIRTIDKRRHEVVAKFLKDQNAWLVLSVWVRGEDDRDWVMEGVQWVLGGLWRGIKKMIFKSG